MFVFNFPRFSYVVFLKLVASHISTKAKVSLQSIKQAAHPIGDWNFFKMNFASGDFFLLSSYFVNDFSCIKL